MLELGAGAGRNTRRYLHYQRVALVDYSRTQLLQAQAHLGESDRYLFVAADVYRLPFVDGRFDGATMIRTLHHMAEPALALSQVYRAMAPGGVFILEFANKHNLKAILRYMLGRQAWSPFTQDPIEFAALNFDFHPKAIWRDLRAAGFTVEKILTVSHFRSSAPLIPLRIWWDWTDFAANGAPVAGDSQRFCAHIQMQHARALRASDFQMSFMPRYPRHGVRSDL